MFRCCSISLVFLMAVAANAQGLMQRKHPDIFPLDGKMKRSGFYIGPGITWTLTRFSDKEEEILRDHDTVYTATFHPKGALGLYLEAGWFIATRDPVILDYWDFGVAYKQLKGSESFEGIVAKGDSIGLYAGEGTFNDQHVTVQVNANKLFCVKDYRFIQATLGANGDYRFSGARDFAGTTAPVAQEFPPQIIGQLHFKLGFGFKLTQRLMIIPAIETPIFSVVPTDKGFGQLQWFSSRYRPLILSVRFLFLRYPNGWACPQVKNNEFEKHKVLNPNYERR